jgi:hypothetical protein
VVAAKVRARGGARLGPAAFSLNRHGVVSDMAWSAIQHLPHWAGRETLLAVIGWGRAGTTHSFGMMLSRDPGASRLLLLSQLCAVPAQMVDR